MSVFMVLSLLGFIASVAVHLASWGHEPLGIEQTWPLHVGIFVAFIPSILAQRKGEREDPRHRSSPQWMTRVLSALAGYALINFLVFALLITAFTPNVRERDGHQVIVSNHEVVRPATDDEVMLHRARLARGFSGHWMFFYWTSLIGMVDARARRGADAAQNGPMPAHRRTIHVHNRR